MKQRQIAKKYGIPASTLSRVLNGKVPVQNLTASTINRLSKVLDMTMDELFRAKPAKLKRRFFERHEIAA